MTNKQINGILKIADIMSECGIGLYTGHAIFGPASHDDTSQMKELVIEYRNCNGEELKDLIRDAFSE